jgi:hypothetical protein
MGTHARGRALPSLLLAAAGFAAAVGVAAPARANFGTFDLQLGATQVTEQTGQGEQTAYRPSMRFSLGLRLVGPLQLGGYVHSHARALPWKDGATGGGALVALRPKLPGIPLRLLLEGSAGRAWLPVAEGAAGGWATAVAAGLGWDLGRVVGLEARAMHTWLHRMSGPTPVDAAAWTFSGGLSLRFF